MVRCPAGYRDFQILARTLALGSWKNSCRLPEPQAARFSCSPQDRPGACGEGDLINVRLIIRWGSSSDLYDLAQLCESWSKSRLQVLPVSGVKGIGSRPSSRSYPGQSTSAYTGLEISHELGRRGGMRKKNRSTMAKAVTNPCLHAVYYHSWAALARG